MTDTAKFDIPDDEPFYIIVSETTTAYKTLEAASDDIGEKFEAESDSFMAKVSIEGGVDGGDVEVELNQVDRGTLISLLA